MSGRGLGRRCAAVLLLLAAACSSDDPDPRGADLTAPPSAGVVSPTPTPTPLPYLDPGSVGLALLTLAEMPGWSLEDSGSAFQPDPDEPCPELFAPFASGASVAFEKSPDTGFSGEFFGQAVAALADSAAAAKAMADFATYLESCVQVVPTPTDDFSQRVETERLAFPTIGDETIALGFEFAFGPFVLESRFISYRYGNAVVFLMHGWPSASRPDIRETKRLARAANRKLNAAIAGLVTPPPVPPSPSSVPPLVVITPEPTAVPLPG